MKFSYTPRKQGFTLIELLVVVLIIAVLAAIALPQYQLAIEKVRANNRIVLMRAILKAQAMYELANGTGTDDVELLDDIQFPYSRKADWFDYGKYYELGNWRYYFLVYKTGHSVVYANKKAGFALNISRSGRGTCSTLDDNSQFGEKVCKALGKFDDTTKKYIF